MRWTDDHCHLGFDDDGGAGVAGDEPAEDDPRWGPIDEVVAAAADAGVERMVTVGTDVATSRSARAAAQRYPNVWATAGVHPHEAKAIHDGQSVIVGSHGLEPIDALLSDPKVVAVGECGLDYHYDHSPRPIQREVFAAQVRLAHEHRLPLVVHSRSAWEDTFAVLEAEGVPATTVIHCFTGGATEAARALDLGCHLSFSGIVTFKSADDVRAAAAACPLDRLLVETDSPFLAPVPHRGKPNRPAWLPLVGEAVARVRGQDAEEVAKATWHNAERVYRLG